MLLLLIDKQINIVRKQKASFEEIPRTSESEASNVTQNCPWNNSLVQNYEKIRFPLLCYLDASPQRRAGIRIFFNSVFLGESFQLIYLIGFHPLASI